jgi:hypothetical protein
VARLLKASGEVVELDTAPTFGQAQALVGGYVAPARLGDGMLLLVNEDGQMLDLPFNKLATSYAHQRLLGDVVLLETDAEIEATLGGTS